MAGLGEVLVKLLLSSSGFDNGIKKSKKQVSDFEKAGQEMGRKLVSSFGQLAGAMLAIKGAGDAFNAVINSSQVIGDSFASTMATAKTVTDNFIYSVANADFSTFNNGLDDMINKAREAYNAMDQLGNTKMSVNYLMSTSGADYKRAMANARDKSLSVEERGNWLKIAEQEMANIVEGQQTVERDAIKAIKTQLSAKTGLDEYFITDDAIKEALLVDSRSTNVKDREKIKKDYDALNKRFSDIKNKAIEDNTVKTTSLMGGTVVTKSKDYNEAVASAQRLIDHLKSQNADLLVSYDLLFRETDEGLNQIISTAQSAIAAQNQVSEMMTSHNEVANTLRNEANSVREATETWQEYQRTIQGVNYVHPTYGGTQLTAMRGDELAGITKNNNPNALPGELPSSVASLEKAPELTIRGTASEEMFAETEMSFGTDEYTESFNANIESMASSIDTLQGAFSRLGNVIGEDNNSMLEFINLTLENAQAIMPLIQKLAAEATARNVNKNAATGEAAAKTMNAHSTIPFVGIALGIAAVAGLIATMQSLPQFAEGGIVTSATLGVFGEAGPEAVMPLDRLNEFVGDREVRVTGKIVGQGKDLSVIIDNYNKVRAVK